MRKAEYINTTITQGLQTNNSKPFWKYINSRIQDNIGVAHLKKNCSLVCDSKEKSSWTSSRVSSPEMVYNICGYIYVYSAVILIAM